MRHCLALLLTVTLLSPQISAASPDAKQKFIKLSNVELDSDGVLSGQLIDEAGIAIKNGSVTVTSRDDTLSLPTDAGGRFAVAGLRGGVCRLRVKDSHYACRVWANGTAPPDSIQTVALVVNRDGVVRGNRGRGCPEDCDNRSRRLYSSEAKYGIAILALGGTAAYFAFSRDNASD